MKKFLTCVCAVVLSTVVQAQTSTVHAIWDPPLPNDGTLSYNLTVDTLPPASVPVSIDVSCACIRTALTVAVGSHTVRVTRLYLLVSTDPNSVTESDPAIVTFTLNSGGQIKNLKIVK